MAKYLLIILLMDDQGLVSLRHFVDLTLQECRDQSRAEVSTPVPMRPNAMRTQLHTQCIPMPMPAKGD